MKILVTGGTGFTGSHLTRRLLQQGHRVVVLDTQPGLFLEELKSLGALILMGSVAEPDALDKAVRGCELVYHVAAAFRDVSLPRRAYWAVNVEGTRRVLEAALRHGVRKVVNCSTCGVHGDVRHGPADENSPIAPADYYQFTKFQGEAVVREFLGKGLQLLTLRPTAIYGPGDPGRFLMLFRMVRRGRFFMFGTGRAHYHPVYIDNLIDAFELAGTSETGDGEAYLIGDARSHTLTDLVGAVAKSLGLELKIRYLPFRPLWLAALGCELACKPLGVNPPLFRRRVDWFRQNRAFNIDKARRELEYLPKVGLEEGLARTAVWYRERGYL